MKLAGIAYPPSAWQQFTSLPGSATRRAPGKKIKMKFPVTFWRQAVRAAFPATIAATILGGSVGLAAPAHAVTPAASQKSAALTWNTFALINQWEPINSAQGAGAPGWAVHNGVVYLRGQIKDSTPGLSATFATLPPSVRPRHNLYIKIATYDLTTGFLFIGHSGSLAASGTYSASLASLDGISFPLSSIKTHKLVLKNGWKSDQLAYGTGDPAYSVSKGIVYLSGSLTGGTNGSAAATLPKAARPGHQIYLSVYTAGGTLGILEILPGGGVLVYGKWAVGYTSLAGVSYPVSGTKWHNFKLINKWKSTAASYPSGTPGYTVINGVVYLTGAIYEPIASSFQWADLPVAIKPADAAEIDTYTYAGSDGFLVLSGKYALINSNPFSNATAYTELAGISYPLSS